jgi:hypothetical protein
VLAVDWPQALPGPACQATDEVAGGHEDLLVGERDTFSILESRYGRAQCRDAGRRDEDEVRIRVCRERNESVWAERRPRRRKLHRKLAKAIDIAVRAERDDPQAVGVRAHDIQRLAPDRTGGAKDRDGSR